VFLLHLKTSNQSWNVTSSTSRAWIYQWGKRTAVQGSQSLEEFLNNDKNVYTAAPLIQPIHLYTQKMGGQKSYASEASRYFLLLWLQLAHFGLGGECLPQHIIYSLGGQLPSPANDALDISRCCDL